MGPVPSSSDPLDHPTTELVRAAQGDRSRIEGLYARLAPSVYAWACLRLRPPLRSTVEPEEIVQEVWCRILQRLDHYDPARASFRTWVFSIANHVILSAWRNLKKEMRDQSFPTLSPGVGDLPDHATSISRVVARDEDLRRCVDSLKSLGGDERQLVIHCGLEGLPAPDVAELLGTTEGALRKRWQRLRAQLQEAAAFRDLFAP